MSHPKQKVWAKFDNEGGWVKRFYKSWSVASVTESHSVAFWCESAIFYNGFLKNTIDEGW